MLAGHAHGPLDLLSLASSECLDCCLRSQAIRSYCVVSRACAALAVAASAEDRVSRNKA
jgi:hypothetical protein